MCSSKTSGYVYIYIHTYFYIYIYTQSYDDECGKSHTDFECASTWVYSLNDHLNWEKKDDSQVFLSRGNACNFSNDKPPVEGRLLPPMERIGNVSLERQKMKSNSGEDMRPFYFQTFTCNMGVSINGGSPKWMVYKGKSY